MDSSLTFVLILTSCLLLTEAQPNFLHQWCYYNDRGNYSSDSLYKSNLDSLLSALNSAASAENAAGFHNLSVGQPPNQVNAISLCRGDVSQDICRGCIINSTQKILEICPNQKEAIGVYDFCSIRYSNRSIFGVKETLPTFYIMGQINATDVSSFIEAQQTLLNRLRGETAGGDDRRKFAKGSETAGFERVYGLMQCSPDLSGLECDDCLREAIENIAGCCSGRLIGSVIKPSCEVWFDNNLFYQVAPPAMPPLPSEGKKSNTGRTIVIIVVPISVMVFGILIFILVRRRRKPRPEAEFSSQNTVDDIDTEECWQLDFESISVATNNFSDQNKLGQGGFGSVYKGTLPNRVEIAVKRLSKGSGQGDLEFKNEVILVAKLQHRNLVRLLGFCLEGNERLLIYEFVPNASLDHFIFKSTKRKYLDWKKRYKIICGIARGLLYLHEDSRLRIIHRDMKASNILLDEDLNPKIADFGMARLFLMDQTQGDTNRIVGTYGYMAPEYARQGHFSVKTDVFSFGVLLLEIISGQRNNSFRNGENIEHLISFAWRNWREGTIANLIDPDLKESSSGEIMRCIHIGLLCVQQNVAIRPTMASIVLMLNSFSLTLPLPSQPAFFVHTAFTESSSSFGDDSNITESQSEEIVPSSRNDASITELHGR